MMKRALILALSLCMAATLVGCVQPEKTAESAATATVTATATATEPAPTRSHYYDKYPEPIADILSDFHLSHAEQNTAISALIQQKQANCEELKGKIEKGVPALFKRYQELDDKVNGPDSSMFSDERLASDLEKFETYYDDTVAMIEEKNEFYKGVHFWQYGLGNWQGTDRLIHTYEFWSDFQEELEHILECCFYERSLKDGYLE